MPYIIRLVNLILTKILGQFNENWMFLTDNIGKTTG